ncbi:hypothetical protein [Phenylobacterium sp.]|jgi:hypothetical protein|uniref:hypothetical protein n=1 Tax=Phenylobacterium sp. TaxID=1871053 RepID=UPI002E30E11C|nr:hypothetical protein [Phenylobacterium sp.]HEX2558916.1 hypothetical protein [Phenylobacterium sp.]
MTVLRPKLWTSLSAAVLLGAGVAACGGEAGGEAGEAGKAAAVGEGGEAAEQGAAKAVGEGGEAAEQGAAQAYGAVPAASKTALQIAHLKGFFLIAQQQKDGAEAAAALAGQGMLEVFDKDPDTFRTAGVDEAVLRKAVQSGSAADLNAAVANLDAAAAKAGGDPAEVVKGLVSVAEGIYRGVVVDGVVDPIEYQHSLGAILAAQSAASRAGDNAKLTAAKAELDKLAALWTGAAAPETPTPPQQVSAQASRVQLALS